MARIDIIDDLTVQLETSTGIPFARDAWVNAAPEQYGVVELGDVIAEQWADGKLIDSVYGVIVTLYVTGSGDDWPEIIQSVLESMEAEGRLISVHTAKREFDMSNAKVRWSWNLMVYGPLITGVDDNGAGGD